MAMTFIHLHTLPSFVPIPELDAHVIRGGQDEGLRGMDNNGTDIIGVCLERGYLFGSIVIVDANLEVIGATDNPILAGYEAASSYRDIGEFKGFDNGLLMFSTRLMAGNDADVPVFRMTIYTHDLSSIIHELQLLLCIPLLWLGDTYHCIVW